LVVSIKKKNYLRNRPFVFYDRVKHFVICSILLQQTL